MNCDLCEGDPKCRTACPVCICGDDPKCLAFSNLGPGKDPKKGDKTLFHLTRILHMLDLCTGCGQCDLACPKGVQVSRLITWFAYKRQDMENWIPGYSKGNFPLLDTQ